MTLVIEPETTPDQRSEFLLGLDPRCTTHSHHRTVKVLPCFKDPAAKKEIQRLCAEHQIDLPLLEDLCEAMMRHSGKGRIDGIDSEISQSLDRFLVRKPEF
jgi:hypothetical protein